MASIPSYTAERDALTAGQIALVTTGRFAINTIYRLIYPLLPFLAPHLGVPLGAASGLVTALALCALSSPLAGALIVRRGPKTAMLTAIGLFSGAALCCALAQSYAMFLVGYLLAGCATAFYIPAGQSFLSARSSYARRGRVLGIFEISWAAAATLGVAPLMLLVQRSGVNAPYWVLLLAGAITLGLLWIWLPADRVGVAAVQTTPLRLGALLRQPTMIGLVLLLLLTAWGVDLILVAQGPWLNGSFGADAATLGSIFACFGIAEIAGSVGSTLLVDRIGKRRAVIGGYSLLILALLLLALLSGSLWGGVGALLLFVLCFEFAIVSTFPLASGLIPAARGAVLALTVAMLGTGRALGSLSAPPLFARFGMAGNAIVAAGLVGLGVVACVLLVREGEQ